MTVDQFRQNLFLTTSDNFEEKALWLFKYQVQFNTTYRNFVNYLGKNPDNITSISDIPFLPIELFKNHVLKTGVWTEETTFTSSGTTGNNTSRHYIRSLDFYLQNTVEVFTPFYGSPKDYVVLALLPSYLERSGSGLISMVNHFIKLSNSTDSGFYLYNHEELANKLKQLSQKGDCHISPKSETRNDEKNNSFLTKTEQNQNKKVILFGVTFALLDFVEKHHIHFPELIVFETGGMKGRKEEMTREEVHSLLKRGFSVPHVHSEYGMTELQSQAYSQQNGLFTTPPWMKVLIRETDDPLTLSRLEKAGGINVIDLANCDTCAFIATEDLGKLYNNGSFEILGRIDHSDARGCNLMVV